MKQINLLLVAILLTINVFSQNKNYQNFYVGTFTSEGAEGFYLCDLNTESGEISLAKTFKAIDNPSFLRLSPGKKYLYVVSRATTPTVENTGGFVHAYKVGKDGDLHFLNKQVSNGNGPCHVDVSADGKHVAIATYGGGTTSLYPVKLDGTLEPASSVIVNKGSGPNKARQSEPHAHSIKFSPYDNQVFSADLGTDRLNIFNLENGKLKKAKQEFVKTPPGAGPRHFEFHPNKEVIYVINELSSTITAIKRENNRWDVFQDISTLPDDFNDISYCADIHISTDGKYLYGSNRGHNSIAVFAVNAENQTLTKLGTVPVEGNWPRNFGISPDGKWMLVANQKSHDITVFKINPKTGMPEFTGKKIELPAPVCIEFL
ncbi:MAG: lactonase family protein [Bacteroidota bacterium]